MLAPVIVFVYARPEHTKRTIEALAGNYLARESDVYVFSDGPKNQEVVGKVNQVREYIKTVPRKKAFKSVEVIEWASNKGLGDSVISGVTSIIREYQKVIVVEDDLVTAPDFLSFMNEALDYYESDKMIWSISGYSFPIKLPKDYSSDIYLSYRGCSWGWGTWKDRWDRVDWVVEDYDTFKNSRERRRKLERGGADLALMLDAQMKGLIDSWAVRWCHTQSKLDMLTVYPVVSRVKNIGLDGTGTHSSWFTALLNTKFNVDLCDSTTGFRLDKPRLDKRIMKQFRRRYGSKFLLSMRQNIREFMRRLGDSNRCK